MTEEPFQLRLPRDGTRSEGLHLSDVIRDLAFTTGVLDAKYNTEIEDAGSEIMQVGLAWEDYLAKFQHPEIMFHPGELELGGIAMSPDGISRVDNEDYASVIGVELDSWVLHEFKLTRKSSRDFKETLQLQGKKALLWLWQLKAYRHALNTMCEAGLECYVAKLHVLFVNGNYSHSDTDPEARPTYKIYRLTFKPSELTDNWDMIMAHSEVMKVNGKFGETPQ